MSKARFFGTGPFLYTFYFCTLPRSGQQPKFACILFIFIMNLNHGKLLAYGKTKCANSLSIIRLISNNF